MNDMIRGITCRDTRDQVEALLSEGWRVTRFTGKNHILLRHEGTGAVLTAPCTPSRKRPRVLLAKARQAVRKRGR